MGHLAWKSAHFVLSSSTDWKLMAGFLSVRVLPCRVHRNSPARDQSESKKDRLTLDRLWLQLPYHSITPGPCNDLWFSINNAIEEPASEQSMQEVMRIQSVFVYVCVSAEATLKAGSQNSDEGKVHRLSMCYAVVIAVVILRTPYSAHCLMNILQI